MRKISFYHKNQVSQMVLAVVLILITAGMRIWPLADLELRVPWVTFYPAVMISSLLGGFLSGITTTLLAVMVVYFWSPTGVPFIDDSGDWLGVVVFFINCSLISTMSETMHRARSRALRAEKREKASLMESERRYRSLFNAMGDGVAVYEPVDDGADFVFRDFNKAAERINSVSKEGILGRRVTEAFPGIEAFGLFEVFRRVHRTGKPEPHTDAFYQDQRISGWRENYVYRLDSGEIVSVHADITERRQVEESLARERALLRQVIDSIPDIIFIKDCHGVFQGCNKAFQKRVGLEQAQILGRTVEELFPEPEASEYETSDAVLFSRGQPTSFEEHTILDDGREVVYDTIKVPFMTDDGKLHGLIGIGRNITERKEMENALKRAEQQYHTLFDISPDGILVIDPETGKMIEFNQAACRQLGYSSEEFGKLRITDYEVIETPEQVRQRIEKLYAHGRDDFETLHKTKQGDIRNVLISVQLVSLGGKDIIHAIYRDITGLRKTEERLSQYAGMVSASQDLMSFVDRSYVYRTVNDAYLKAFGVSREEIVDHPVADILGEAFFQGVKPSLDECLAGSPVHLQKWTDFPARGRRYQDVSLFPHHREDGTVDGIVVTSRDSTERKKMEDALKASEEEANRANRAKSEFLANMSHEIRTPMNTITGMSYLVLQGELTDRQRDYLLRIDGAAKSLLRIIDDILDFSKIEAGRMTLEEVPFNLDDVFNRLADSVLVKAEEKGLEVLFFFAPDLPRHLVGDPVRLGQVLFNLGSNALKFTERGGDHLQCGFGGIGTRRSDPGLFSPGYRGRSRSRGDRGSLRILPTKGFQHHAPIRGHRSGAGHLPGPGGAHGRRDQDGERAGPGNHGLLHRPLRSGGGGCRRGPGDSPGSSRPAGPGGGRQPGLPGDPPEPAGKHGIRPWGRILGPGSRRRIETGRPPGRAPLSTGPHGLAHARHERD